MKSIKLVLFDFDGTISDSHEAAIQIYNDLSDKFGYRKVVENELPELRNKTSREVLKALGIPLLKLPFVVREARMRFQMKTDSLMPIEGIHAALQRIKELDYKIGILTSNSSENVVKFLQRNNLDIFDFVSTGASIFGKGKVIKNLLKKSKFKPNEALYVGDETRDIDAAKAAGIRVVSVSWGFNSKKILQSQNPDYLIDSPMELPTLLGNHSLL